MNLKIALILFLFFLKGNAQNSLLELESLTLNKDIELIKVKGGNFLFGCQFNDSLKCSKQFFPKPYKGSLKTFYISKNEITTVQFEKFIKETNYKTTADKNGFSYNFTKPNHLGFSRTIKEEGLTYKNNDKENPVTHISWYDCQEFCKWLSKKTGYKILLPTNEQWEYAARGGQKTTNFLFSGSNVENEVAWNFRNSGGKVHKVGKLKSNELKIYDMSGNAWEWVQDSSKEDLNIVKVRGGSYKGKYYGSYFDYDKNVKNLTIAHTGFRIVMIVKE